MRDPCSIAEEIIWDCAREGAELPEETSRHVASCESCARTLKLVGPTQGLLQAAARVEATVDRSVIMDRLAPRRRLVPVWSFGLAVVALLAIAVVGLKVAANRQMGPKPAPIIARRNAPSVPRVQPRSPVKIALGSTNAPANRISGQHPRIRRLHRVAGKRTTGKTLVAHLTEKRTIVPGPSERLPEARVDEHPVGSQPVAAVTVTWNVQRENKDISYQYHDTDPNTGEVTEGTVKRTGNIIEIHLEPKPTGTPIKGEIKNETNPNA